MSLKSVNQVTSEIDCGDKKCSLHHRYLDKCTIFLHTNVTNCKIPCQLEGCKIEIRHFMNCPVWECNDYTTTPMTTTSTESSSTSRPTPHPHPPSHSLLDIVLYSSLGVNAFFLLGLFFFTIFKICKKRQEQRQRNRTQAAYRQRFPSLLPNDNAYFTLGGHSSSGHSSNENIPLLNRNPQATNPQATFYSDTLTSHVSLSSTPTSTTPIVIQPEIQSHNDLVEARNLEREEMLSRTTSFKGTVPKSPRTSTKSLETERETVF
jgi:hypothetical protein